MYSASERRVDALMRPIMVRPAHARRERPGSVIPLQVAAARRVNLRAFDALIEGMRVARGADARIEAFHDVARAAIASFPVPLLGPGMLRLHASLEDGNESIANLLAIIAAAQSALSASTVTNPAEAFCSAFAARLGGSMADTRARILKASRDCEFFSPELVLMLEAWVPPG